MARTVRELGRLDVLVNNAAEQHTTDSITEITAEQLVGKGIRVNAVAPGPIWTPLIPATMPEEKVTQFGKGRPHGPARPARGGRPCYLFLATDDASYMAGQVLHPNGGNVVNG